MRIYRTAVPFLVVLIAAAVGGCTKKRPSEEEVIRRTIETVANAAQKRDIQTIKETVSPDYRDPQGNDRDALYGLLLAHFFRAEDIGVVITGSQVTVEGRPPLQGAPGHPREIGRERAKSHTEAILIRGPRPPNFANILLKDATYYRFDIEWRKESNGWKVLSASWGPMERSR